MSADLLGARVVRGSGIASKRVGTEWVILEPNKQYVRKLNENAGFLWAKTTRAVPVSSLVRGLAAKFSIPERVAERDVIVFIRQYLRDGLLMIVS